MPIYVNKQLTKIFESQVVYKIECFFYFEGDGIRWQSLVPFEKKQNVKKKHLFSLTYGRVPIKGSNTVLTQNRHINV